MPVLENAARRFGAQIEIALHAFELRPEPVPLLDPRGEYLQEHWNNRVYPMATERGLVMRLPPLQTRTRRAHETAAFARAHGRLRDVDVALYRAFFEHGHDINDVEVLAGIVAVHDLDPAALRIALRDGEFADVVQADAALAERLGIRSVPTMLVGESVEDAEPVVGAVPYMWLHGAIERALAGDRSHARLRRRFRPELPVIE